MKEMKTGMDIFYDRRSVRLYTEEKIPDEDIDKILRAGFYAPTAVNKQETDFIVVTDRTKMEEINKVHPYAKMLLNCSHAIIVCGDLKKSFGPDYWVCDASAATENILLCAHMLGYGAVWLGVYPEKDRMEGVKKIFNLPEHIEVLSIVSLGVPKRTDQKRPERYDETRVHHETW